MFIEIFGESPIECELLRKHVKGGQAENSNRPSVGISNDVLGGKCILNGNQLKNLDQ